MQLNRLSAGLMLALMMSGPVLSQSLQAQQAEIDAQRARGQAQVAAGAARDAAMAEQAAAHASQAAAQAEQAAAQASQAGVRGSAGKRTPMSERDELAIAALEGLMSAPDARALPILQKVLNGNHSDLVKSRALFVLSQIGLDQAQLTLLEYVRNAKGDLRGEAVRSIGIGGNAKSLEALMPIYDSGDGSLRPQIVEALMIAGRKDLVMKIALAAKSEGEADHAIQMLSALGAVDELRQLGAQGKHSGSLIHAYAIAGDLQSLRLVAEGKGPVDQREEAIRSIGIVSSKEGNTALREIYAKVSEPQLKDAALQGMLISGDQQGVLALYRAATNLQEKRNLLRTLSMMGGDAALEAIDAALQGNAP